MLVGDKDTTTCEACIIPAPYWSVAAVAATNLLKLLRQMGYRLTECGTTEVLASMVEETVPHGKPSAAGVAVNQANIKSMMPWFPEWSEVSLRSGSDRAKEWVSNTSERTGI